jgi:hypothetical protein
MAKLNAAARKALPKNDFAVPSKAPKSGSYPINNPSHARNALARSSGKPVAGQVQAAVAKKYPAMVHGNSAKAAPKMPVTTQMVKAIKNSPKGKLPAGLARYMASKKG